MRCTVPAAAAVLSAALLSGCATDGSAPLLQTAGKSFSDGAAAGAKVLTTETDAAADVERAFLIYGEAPRPPATYDSKFAVFACAGVDSGATAQAGVSAVNDVAKTVGTLTAAPSADLGEVLASIAKYQDDTDNTPGAPKPATPDVAVKLPGAPGGQQAKCLDKVTLGLKDLNTAYPAGKTTPTSIAAVFAAVDAVNAAYTAAKALFLTVAQADDTATRLKRLSSYLASADTEKAMTTALGPCAAYNSDLFGADGKLKAPVSCKGTGQINPQGGIDDLFQRRVAATLVLPYLQYADTMSQMATIKPHEAAERLATVKANLAAFDAIRTQSPPGDTVDAMAKAYLNLRRLAAGDLTDAEKQKALANELSQFYDFVKQLDTETTTLQTKAKAAQTAIGKL